MRLFRLVLVLIISLYLQLNILLPIVFCLICLFILVLSFVSAFWECVIGTLITLTGIPVFLLFVKFEDKHPTWFVKMKREFHNSLKMSVPWVSTNTQGVLQYSTLQFNKALFRLISLSVPRLTKLRRYRTLHYPSVQGFSHPRVSSPGL